MTACILLPQELNNALLNCCLQFQCLYYEPGILVHGSAQVLFNNFRLELSAGPGNNNDIGIAFYAKESYHEYNGGKGHKACGKRRDAICLKTQGTFFSFSSAPFQFFTFSSSWGRLEEMRKVREAEWNLPVWLKAPPAQICISSRSNFRILRT